MFSIFRIYIYIVMGHSMLEKQRTHYLDIFYFIVLCEIEKSDSIG